MTEEIEEYEEESPSKSAQKVRWPVVYAVLFAILFALAGYSCSGKDSCPAVKDFLSCFVVDGTGFEKCKFFGGTGKAIEKKDDTPKPEDTAQWDDNADGRKDYFETIWRVRKWGSGKPGEVPRSGPGSVFSVTANIRKSFKKFLMEQEIFDMADIGCGDLNWMPAVLRETKTRYIGLDIVEEVIVYDRPRFERNHTMEFGTIDIVEQTPPQRDVYFLREVLPHTLADSALKALKHLSSSGGKWLVMTTFPGPKSNPDTRGHKLTMKSYFHWNFEIAPFNLGKPVTYLNDSWDQSPMGLWRLPLWGRKSSEMELRKWEDSPEARKELFEVIWKENHWGDKGEYEDPRSGQGSTLFSTLNVRKGLIEFINKFNIKSMIDVPCGDMTWMPEVLKEVHLESYLGVDIVQEMIDQNKERFASLPFMKFEVLDAVKDPLPKADVIFVRELFQHMLRDTARQAIENMRKSGSRWLVATSFQNTYDNWDTTAMKTKMDMFIYWPWNLELAPFEIGKPLFAIPDYHRGMVMGLWLLNDDGTVNLDDLPHIDIPEPPNYSHEPLEGEDQDQLPPLEEEGIYEESQHQEGEDEGYHPDGEEQVYYGDEDQQLIDQEPEYGDGGGEEGGEEYGDEPLPEQGYETEVR
mmetsp:Transcript_43948/g.73251  ORF Transcript_43948/g.73251 Transcript_43948/m.73251 type:complete len:635 (+) Transcript_43948:180-2084(+)|eukprot:CAMPEP_0184660430 /NCGR_PEP_ID=MMETSP0308-20130426/33888_1 /TAXON_ID=38269 /ORGANISM="Gloeochaete witrockiana, Strain SAG 46.84" /LENGTH=634 /DNA_ID=CAMNT_0027101013 /DNA_START=107 /DNA_END=2011 /DNA_ORIENTATION=-